MLTLDEYLRISKSIIKKHGYSKMLKDEDAISYVATSLMKADSKYNGTYGSIEGFRGLYGRYAIKNWIDRYVKNKKTINITENMAFCLKSIDSTFGNVALNEILGYIDTLPIHQKDAISMYFYEKMTLQEIADKTGITRQGISLRIRTAINKIREKFND